MQEGSCQAERGYGSVCMRGSVFAGWIFPLCPHDKKILSFLCWTNSRKGCEGYWMTLSCYSLMGEESLLIKTDSRAGLVWGGDPRCWSHFGRFSSWMLWVICLLQTWHSSSQIERTVLPHWKVPISSMICHLLSPKQFRWKENKKHSALLSKSKISRPETCTHTHTNLPLTFSHRCSCVLNFIQVLILFSAKPIFSNCWCNSFNKREG